MSRHQSSTSTSVSANSMFSPVPVLLLCLGACSAVDRLCFANRNARLTVCACGCPSADCRSVIALTPAPSGTAQQSRAEHSHSAVIMTAASLDCEHSATRWFVCCSRGKARGETRARPRQLARPTQAQAQGRCCCRRWRAMINNDGRSKDDLYSSAGNSRGDAAPADPAALAFQASPLMRSRGTRETRTWSVIG